jgi:DNA-binding LacI/PurR family transcriptional regulator
VKVTSADVAKAAGVSRATVSYVLNGVDARVSDQTRQRVLTCARELGYVPHAHASALRGGRTSVVVIAMPAWPLGPPMAEAISTLVTELDGLGYTPLVHFRHWSGPDGLTKACDRVRPVGLLAPFADLPAERVEALKANGTRAIIALAPEPQAHVPALAFDQRLVGEVAIEHLADRGHTRVLAITPPRPSCWSSAASGWRVRRPPARGGASRSPPNSTTRPPSSPSTTNTPSARSPACPRARR